VNYYVGTSGYAYKEWKGSFYPADLPAAAMLRYYGERFRTVEINNTFYRMPKESVLEDWATQVPADFRFVLKSPQRITHIQRLKGSEESTEFLFKVAATLQERLGPILFQLPPNLKQDLPRLRDFLALVPPRIRVAFEFRHESWFDDPSLQLLRDHGVSLCIAEAEDGVEVPFVATADWGYVRLRRPDYGPADLKKWAELIAEQTWSDAFVFFKHEDEGVGPKLAKKFGDLVGK
jgi:uncharacterized protein YecE (DUF72 family)